MKLQKAEYVALFVASCKNAWFKLIKTETLLDPPHAWKGTERRRPSGDPTGPDAHLDEGVVTNLREIVTSQRTDFQNCVFEPRFPHSEASKTSERWTSLMFTDSQWTRYCQTIAWEVNFSECQSNFTDLSRFWSNWVLEFYTFTEVIYLFCYPVTEHTASLSSNGPDKMKWCSCTSVVPQIR